MKATKLFSSATAVAAAAAVVAVPHAAHAMQKAEEGPSQFLLPQDARNLQVEDEKRELMHFTVEFEECVGLTLEACQAEIQKQVAENPEIFEHRSSLNYEVMHVRTAGSSNYNKVGLRTNLEETHVVGVLGDGMVFYPWEWCTPSRCYEVGPWDCDVGTPLTVEGCCNMIKASVPDADVNGNMIDCYADHPVGSVSKPIDYGRVCIHVNDRNIVVRPPKNE